MKFLTGGFHYGFFRALTKVLFFGLGAFGLAACAASDQQVNSGQLSDITQNPLPNTPGAPAFLPGNGAGGAKPYPTTTGGYFTVSKVEATTLVAAQSFKGFASDAGAKYSLIKRSVGGGIYWWDIFRSDYLTGYQLLCSILDDGQFTGYLRKDGGKFYIRNSNYSNPRYRVFDAATCAEQASIVFTMSPDANGFTQSQSYDDFTVLNQILYFTATDYSSNTRLKKYDLTGFNIQTAGSTGSIAGQTNGWKQSATVTSSAIWNYTVDTTVYPYVTRLWKTSLSTGTPIAWAVLPADDYPDFAINPYSASGPSVTISSRDGVSLLVTISTPPTGYKTFTLDVTHF